MYPTIGRIVHYTDKKTPPDTVAAIITEVVGLPDPHNHKHECSEGCAEVSLTAFFPGTLTFLEEIPFSSNPKAGCWSWPSRSM